MCKNKRYEGNDDMKKGILALLLTAVMMGGILTGTMKARAEITTYTSGDYIYSLKDGNAIIRKYKGTDANLVIPATLDGHPVTALGSYSFNGCDTLVEVTVPEGVAEIHNDVFDECKNLTTLYLPSTVTNIYLTGLAGRNGMKQVIVAEDNPTYASEDGVLYNKGKNWIWLYPKAKEGAFQLQEGVSCRSDTFKNCVGLTKITLPNSFSRSDISFEGCSSLTEIVVGEDNQYLSTVDGVLYNKAQTVLITYPARKKQTADIPSTVTTISGYAFWECSLSTIMIPNSVTTINKCAFDGWGKLTTITLPDSVEYLGAAAFRDCEKLTEVHLSNKITEIGWSTFEECISLKEISIPASVTKIDDTAFWGCTNLEKIEIDEKNTSFVEENGILFNADKTKLIHMKKSYEGSYFVPESVTQIEESALISCHKLTELYIPAKVTSIGVLDCEALTGVHVDAGNTVYASKDGVLYNKDMTKLFFYPMGKADETFVIPDSVTEIMEYSFEGNCNLRFLVIPPTVTSIAECEEGWIDLIFYAEEQDTILMITAGSAAEEYVQECSYDDGMCYYRYCYGHNYTSEVTTAPTCTKTGVRTYTCTTASCKHTYTEVVPKKAHTYKTTTTKATTEKDGSVVQKCKVCGYEKSKKPVYRIKSVKLSTTSYTYNGKEKKPSVTVTDRKGNTLKEGKNGDYTVSYPKGRKNVGKYQVTIQFRGKYTGKVTKTFTIRPKATTIRAVTAQKKGFKVTWKAQNKQVTGYQIQYSTSSKFTEKTTKTTTIKKYSTSSKSVTKLKAQKKYYVRIRTYKTVEVNGKSTKIYSKWSETSKVTTRK